MARLTVFGSADGAAPLKEMKSLPRRQNRTGKPIPQDYIPFPSMSRQKHGGRF